MSEIAMRPAKDRRRSPRLAVRFPVTVRGIDLRGERFRHVTRLENISHEGLYVVVPALLIAGARVFALVRMSESDSARAARLAVRGVVVRTADQPEGVGLGVHFTRWRFL